MKTEPGRRFALMTMGLGMVAGATGLAALRDGVASAAEPSLLPSGAKSLEELTARLNRAPRRDFKTVPMILNHPDQWDHAALSEVIAYRDAPKQVWDNTGIAGPWLNAMRIPIFSLPRRRTASRVWRCSGRLCGRNTSLRN